MKTFFRDKRFRLYQGDCLTVLPELPGDKFHACVTSPPYWALRDYGRDTESYDQESQIGSEREVQNYVDAMVKIFREVYHVLRPDGSLWLNIGDTWVDKQLMGVPWRVALALQADGWILRQDIIWSKLNPLPSSVKDRFVPSHEYIFLLTKSKEYYFDLEKVKEPCYRPGLRRAYERYGTHSDGLDTRTYTVRTKRGVWNVATVSGSTDTDGQRHFARYPLKLIRPCIEAGCPKDGWVLDPFMGSGTTAIAAKKLNRRCVGIELNEEWCQLALNRWKKVASRGDFGL